MCLQLHKQASSGHHSLIPIPLKLSGAVCFGLIRGIETRLGRAVISYEPHVPCVSVISADRRSSVSREADDSNNCNVVGFPPDTLLAVKRNNFQHHPDTWSLE